jgi:hypothetical protein
LPARIRVVGALFCIAGGLAVLSMLYDLVAGNGLLVRFDVLLLVVGIGLVRGKFSSQRWALAWIAFGFVLSLALFALTATAPSEASVSSFGWSLRGMGAFATIAALELAYLSLLAWMGWALLAGPMEAFNRGRERESLDTAMEPTDAAGSTRSNVEGRA